VDPLADKYYTFSNFSYVANNPLKYVDPNGKEIRLSSYVRDDGTTVVQMNVTGKLINQSSTDYSGFDMANYASRLGNAIKDYYSVKEKGFEVEVSVDIKGVTYGDSFLQPLREGDHGFYIRDDGYLPDPDKNNRFMRRGVLGVAGFGRKSIYLSKDILEGKAAKQGKNKKTGLTENGEATLERTGAHELGHSAGNKHPEPDEMPDNLMHQSGRPYSGTKITRQQMMDMLTRFENGELNKDR